MEVEEDSTCAWPNAVGETLSGDSKQWEEFAIISNMIEAFAIVHDSSVEATRVGHFHAIRQGRNKVQRLQACKTGTLS